MVGDTRGTIMNQFSAPSMRPPTSSQTQHILRRDQAPLGLLRSTIVSARPPAGRHVTCSTASSQAAHQVREFPYFLAILGILALLQGAVQGYATRLAPPNSVAGSSCTPSGFQLTSVLLTGVWNSRRSTVWT